MCLFVVGTNVRLLPGTGPESDGRATVTSYCRQHTCSEVRVPWVQFRGRDVDGVHTETRSRVLHPWVKESSFYSYYSGSHVELHTLHKCYHDPSHQWDITISGNVFIYHPLKERVFGISLEDVYRPLLRGTDTQIGVENDQILKYGHGAGVCCQTSKNSCFTECGQKMDLRWRRSNASGPESRSK